MRRIAQTRDLMAGLGQAVVARPAAANAAS
jgi:hypothetical protein